MVFGFGFNKKKVLGSAEKLLAQGKISAAIEEYRKAISRDPKDLTLMTTLADLYVREGRNEEAVKVFYKLSDQFMDAGLVPRAIAVYKRITKILPDAIEPILKLGDLYAMQGLLRDSRANYLQAVEYHLRRNQKDQARDVFEKVLMLDMENPQLQLQMAELYQQTGKNEEAVSTYLSAIERLLDRNQSDQAASAIQALLQIDPSNADARIYLGRSQMDRGEFEQAVETLESIPALETHRPALNLLFHAYGKKGDTERANQIAQQIFDQHGDFAALAQVSDSLLAEQRFSDALKVYEDAFDQLVAERATSCLVQGLRAILAREPQHIPTLQVLLKLYQQTGNLGDARETMELMARAYRQKGDLEKARDIYSELVMIESDNPDHLHLLRQVEAQMGGVQTPEGQVPEPAASMVTGLSDEPAAEPPKPPAASPRDEKIVRDAMTEADLFITYHQMGRAIEALESALVQAPGNTTLYEHILPLYEQLRDYAKATAVCEALAEAYVKCGDGERASRYGELILSYQQKTQEYPGVPESAVVEEDAPAEFALTESEDGDGLRPAAVHTEVHEVDLSMDWASAVAGQETAPESASDSASVEEIEFYIQAGLLSDAADALQKFEQRNPSHPALEGFRARLGVAGSTTEAQAPSTLEPGQEQPATLDFPAALTAATPAESEADALAFLNSTPEMTTAPGSAAVAETTERPSAEALVAAKPPAAPAAEFPAAMPQAVLHSANEEQELRLEHGVQAGNAPVSAAAFELTLDEPQLAPATPQAPAPIQSLARELDLSQAEPARPAAAARPSEFSPQAVVSADQHLQDLFAEFKAEMEEPASGQDIETHYNMGVAFQEMALYDEAIGEFQKVHQLAAELKDYSHEVQCCSLLATCFLEKGLPDLAVKWYQTALHSPAADAETVLALLYELGLAQETAGDRQAALRSFLDVYSRNIDYRDVANRIRSLQQP